MRTNILFFITLVSMFFMGCNVENVDDSINSSANLQFNANISKTKVFTRPFKVKGSGTFEVVAPSEFQDLIQVLIQGQGNATHLGLFHAEITYCTDFEYNHYLTGKQIAANGDEIYFYSVGFGVDDEGEWTEYIYSGGTGRFENASGELKLYGVSEFTGPTSGVYKNHGSGTLSY